MEDKFKEVNTIFDLISIYNSDAKGYFEMRLNSYCTKNKLVFWEVLKEVVDKAGDKYDYKALIEERYG